jgi:hypothetical protein
VGSLLILSECKGPPLRTVLSEVDNLNWFLTSIFSPITRHELLFPGGQTRKTMVVSRRTIVFLWQT